MKLCPVRIRKMVNKGGVLVQDADALRRYEMFMGPSGFRACGRRVHAFVRLTYGELCNPLETKFDDVFGICQDHIDKMKDPAIWAEGYQRCVVKGSAAGGSAGGWMRGDAVVAGLRGLVTGVERIEAPANPEEERMRRRLESHKANIKRIMLQSNAKGITADLWRELFEEIVREVTMKEVMEA